MQAINDCDYFVKADEHGGIAPLALAVRALVDYLADYYQLFEER